MEVRRAMFLRDRNQNLEKMAYTVALGGVLVSCAEL